MRRSVKYAIWIAINSAVALPAAAQTSGPLGVATTVPSSCTAPSPDGNLNVALNVNRDFDGQFFSNVNVEIICQGGAEVSQISFDPGTSDGSYSGANYRGMVNSAGDVIFYELVAAPSTFASASDANYQSIPVTGGDATYDHSTWPSSTPELNMRAKITGGKLSDDTELAMDATSEVPPGTYNDTVLMTLTFGAGA